MFVQCFVEDCEYKVFVACVTAVCVYKKTALLNFFHRGSRHRAGGRRKAKGPASNSHHPGKTVASSPLFLPPVCQESDGDPPAAGLCKYLSIPFLLLRPSNVEKLQISLSLRPFVDSCEWWEGNKWILSGGRRLLMWNRCMSERAPFLLFP